jgi:DNA-binding NarL/FixJ family response regulator
MPALSLPPSVRRVADRAGAVIGDLRGRHEPPAGETHMKVEAEQQAQPVPGPAGLSPRELDVIRLLPLGYTNRQIAAELTLGQATVATHIRHILQKTNSANRAEAAAYAVRHGL